mgnify:CR=1 FL=1
MKKSTLLFIAFLSMTSLLAQEKNVMVMEIKDVIDPRMHRYVDLALSEAEAIKAKELDGVIARIKEAIQHYGLTAADLGLKRSRSAKSGTARKTAAKRARPGKTRKGTGVIKFRSADGQTWTGHGRAPNWFKAALAAGAARRSLGG